MADNVDPERILLNRIFVQEDLRSVYDNVFGEALKAYNARQKRKDRLKGDYITEIKNSGNGENVFYENVVQVGTMEDTPVLDADGIPTIDGNIAADVLSKYAETFQERNPNLYLFNAVLHIDEATPHLHLDYIPVAHGYKTGMETRNSLTKALQQMGFEKATGKNRNETMAWQEKERAYLTKLCNEHGIEVEIKGEDKRKNLTVSEYKEAMQEVAAIKEQAVELSTEKELLLTDNARLEEANAGLENRHDELSAKIIALDEKVDKKKKSWDIPEKKTVKLEEKHKKISDLDEAFERNIHVYDESDKWQLPEPELLQTAKSYRDKSAKPLVDTLKKVVKDLTLRVIKLVEEVKEIITKGVLMI